MSSDVCSSAPHLQIDESNTKLHLSIVERNSPTPVRKRFSLTQEGLGGSFSVVRSQEMEKAVNVWNSFHES